MENKMNESPKCYGSTDYKNRDVLSSGCKRCHFRLWFKLIHWVIQFELPSDSIWFIEWINLFYSVFQFDSQSSWAFIIIPFPIEKGQGEFSLFFPSQLVRLRVMLFFYIFRWWQGHPYETFSDKPNTTRIFFDILWCIEDARRSCSYRCSILGCWSA